MRLAGLAILLCVAAYRPRVICPTDAAIACPPGTTRTGDRSHEGCVELADPSRVYLCGFRGSLHGPLIVRFENGCTALRGQYEHGQEIGAWTWFYSTGEPELIGEYALLGSDAERQQSSPPMAWCDGLADIERSRCEIAAKFHMLRRAKSLVR